MWPYDCKLSQHYLRVGIVIVSSQTLCQLHLRLGRLHEIRVFEEEEKGTEGMKFVVILEVVGCYHML